MNKKLLKENLSGIIDLTAEWVQEFIMQHEPGDFVPMPIRNRIVEVRGVDIEETLKMYQEAIKKKSLKSSSKSL